MSTDYVQLEEYSKNPVVVSFETKVELTEALLEISKTNETWKKKLGLRNNPFEVTVLGKSLLLAAKGITGFLKIGKLQVEVVPKFLSTSSKDNKWRIALTRALFLTDQENLFDDDYTFSRSSDSLLPDLMAETFINSVEKGFLFGLPRSYTETREALPFYRGTYDSSRFTEHLLKPHLIPCKFDEFTTDNKINQSLMVACYELAKTVYSSRLSVRLEQLGNRFNATYLIPNKVELENIVLQPQYNYLSDALQIAKLVFSNKGLEHNEGDLKIKGFLWDSSTIFEKLVKLIIWTYCLRSKKYSFTDESTSLMQMASRVTSQGKVLIDTTPDVRILENKQTKFLLDAKYKTWSKQPKNEDVYQVMAGSRVTKCPLSALVYPLPEDRNGDTIIYNIKGQGMPKVISTIFIDIKKLASEKGLDEIIDKFEKDLNVLSNCYN
ncbi:hypothetical protein QA612_20190 [Evansella sp. AB-P1]|uniref:5-methylcytosine restriction system specificity protein McrC n=1 Tax=Evansella sp. AB-P1 TaxID=3037653 RepID=UPI00241DE676|nr:hypothetical protein [Evansella sp. AB-P1]MDG5789783.1 hypothetical protein [Evansella sp. AB-P1]